jgi:hypothetical protein
LLARHVQARNEVECNMYPFGLNPLTKMCCLVITFQILLSSFPMYVKLIKLTMAYVVSNMEDERCFSTLAFIKSKRHNRVTTHLPQMLCACLDNNSIHCKISCMKNALSNEKQHDTDIVMMVKSFVGFLHLFLQMYKLDGLCFQLYWNQWLFYKLSTLVSMMLAWSTHSP